MVLRKIRQVIVPRFGYREKLHLTMNQVSQFFTMMKGDQPVPFPMHDENRTIYFSDKVVSPDLIFQQPLEGKEKAISTNLVEKT